MRNDRSDIVVVGVDGSVASVSALVAGLRDARARRLTVEVVTAWSEHGPTTSSRATCSPAPLAGARCALSWP